MEFRQFNSLIQKRLNEITKDAKKLFVVDVDGDTMWNTYLNSFPQGTNEIFRKRSEHDCSCCRHFIKLFGNVVAIINNQIESIWKINAGDNKYQPVANAMNDLILSRPVNGVYVTTLTSVGTGTTRDESSSIVWDHFKVTYKDALLTRITETFASHVADYREDAAMLQRALREISFDALDTVIDLTRQKSLYRGEEFLDSVKKFRIIKEECKTLSTSEFVNYCWAKSVEISTSLCRIRNTAIGTLLVDLSNEVEVEDAVKSFESKVAPENYRRPKPVFTQGMLDKARQRVIELGLMESLPRRFAVESDISVNDVLWVNRSVAPQMQGDAFSSLAAKTTAPLRDFGNVRAISISEFMEMLPSLSSIQMQFENRHAKKLVSLIAPQNTNAKPLFKWGNTSWVYNGNLTDSAMKEQVAKMGGDIHGILRFSISWTHNDDLDAHCEYSRNHIYYANRRGGNHTGELDVDIINPVRNILSVENITFANKSKMPVGDYKFYVNCYNKRNSSDGFKAEIEFGGDIYEFDYAPALKTGQNVHVATVTLGKNGDFTIKPAIDSNLQQRTVWGLKTNDFHDVKIVTLSPNHWNGKQIGNKHYLFMLKGCINPDQPSGFFNEFLIDELREDRKVFEALSNEMRVEPSQNQLSGLGFSSTQQDDIVVKVSGSSVSKVMKVQF